MIVAGGHDDPSGGDDLLRPGLHDLAVLVVERLVHLVEQQHVRPGKVGRREAESGAHPLGVARDGALERVLEAAAPPDVLQAGRCLGPREAREDAEEHRVLAAGQRRHQARADGQERRDLAGHRHVARVGDEHACEHPQERRLAGPARAEQPDRLARLRVEGHVPQAPRLGSTAPQPGEVRCHHASVAVELELDAERLCADPRRHSSSTIFASWRCSDR